jgi:hypothetical protein
MGRCDRGGERNGACSEATLGQVQVGDRAVRVDLDADRTISGICAGANFPDLDVDLASEDSQLRKRGCGPGYG